MECRNCPYGEEDFNRRISCYNKIAKERGVPNDVYGDMTYEDAIRDAEEFLWCDKVGGKVFVCWYCTDAHGEDFENNNHVPKKKKRTKRERDLCYRRKLKRLHEASSVCKERQKEGNNLKRYYKRQYRGRSSKYLKRASNKAIRRYKKGLSNGCQCHKIFDFEYNYD